MNQKQQQRLAVVVAAVITTAVSMLGAGPARGQGLQGEYKLGVLEPLTGNLAVQGKLHLEVTRSCATSSTRDSAA